MLEQQQSVATSTSVLSKTSQNGNGNNSSNSSGNSVLHRVISLTTANHNNNDKNSSQTKPTFISEKLQFSAYEKFEGELLKVVKFDTTVDDVYFIVLSYL